MDRGVTEQSVTRHAAASRAAYETLYAAFASQPHGIKDSHRGVLDSLRAELRLDQSFAQEVQAKHGKKGKGGAAGGSGGQTEERGGGGVAGGLGGEGPAIQIAWKEVRPWAEGGGGCSIAICVDILSQLSLCRCLYTVHLMRFPFSRHVSHCLYVSSCIVWHLYFEVLEQYNQSSVFSPQRHPVGIMVCEGSDL